ncbi:MAG: acetate--CoA ligase [Rickettsiales bacterium]|nr:acetate--CoA ligase [Rickettsiales bacterium]
MSDNYPPLSPPSNRGVIDASVYRDTYDQSIHQRDAYWEQRAKETLDWHSTDWEHVSNCHYGKDDTKIEWFKGGTLNVAENCVDRHAAAHPDRIAIIWEPDDPNAKALEISYSQLKSEVCKTANMLLELGVKEGDRVTIYMPMIPEAAYTMLACARIGAIHSVVFAGFSPQSLRDRINDCGSEIVITASEGVRGGKKIPLKQNVDLACEKTSVSKVLVVNKSNEAVNWVDGRDIWWHELAETVDNNHTITPYDAETPLFILYTSGSTGKPKGLLHSSAGYLLYAAETYRNVFDSQSDDIFWCTADIGWITGHSYMIYGPLAAGATTLLFEGVPNFPDSSRFWQIVDKHRVSLFYTAPTAIRMLMREGEAYLKNTSRDSLRILGSVGEPINPEAWRWYHEQVGKSKCAIVDTWWQTETGGHLITPLPYANTTKPGAAMQPYFGVQPVLCDAAGDVVEGKGEGALCIAASWPGQARTIWGDHQRFIETYFSAYPGYYFSGDAAERDDDGHYWIRGRMDDVINVSGHRIGTAEIESALVLHDAVTEAAVVPTPHDIKGQAIYAFVTLKPDVIASDALKKELNQFVRTEIGPIASLEQIQFADAVPKTRSGKIIRRILRKIASGDVQSKQDYEKLGDISTLLNPDSVDSLVDEAVQLQKSA